MFDFPERLRRAMPPLVNHRSLVLGLCLFAAQSGSAQSYKPSSTATTADAALREASGLAASPRNPPLVWSHNDSGNAPQLFLLAPDGSAHGSVSVTGARNRDWEDMDAFTFRGRSWLLLADTGDNRARHDSSSIHVFPEPDGRATVAPSWTIRFRYPDGPRDCEAVAADPRARTVLLISKRTKPPMAYELPLEPTSQKILTARALGPVRLPRADFWEGPFADQPTGLAISPDGRLAAVLTYARVFLFRKEPDETWATAFSRKPDRLARHGLRQAEGITFSRDGSEITVISEGGGMMTYSQRP